MRFGGVPSLFGGFKFEEVHETKIFKVLKVQGSLLFVPYTIIQGIISSEM